MMELFSAKAGIWYLEIKPILYVLMELKKQLKMMQQLLTMSFYMMQNN